MNYGQIIAWVSVVLNAGSSIGYGIAGDWRHSLYFLFAAAITATVIV